MYIYFFIFCIQNLFIYIDINLLLLSHFSLSLLLYHSFCYFYDKKKKKRKIIILNHLIHNTMCKDDMLQLIRACGPNTWATLAYPFFLCSWGGEGDLHDGAGSTFGVKWAHTSRGVVVMEEQDESKLQQMMDSIDQLHLWIDALSTHMDVYNCEIT